MSMRVLLLDTGKEWGGGTNSLFELLKRIDRRRFDISALFYDNYRKGKDSDVRSELASLGIALELLPPRPQPLWAKLAKELIRGFLGFLPESRRRWLRAVERRWRIDPAARAIARRLREGGYDLLYMNNQPSSNLEGYLASELSGIPVVQHCRSNADLVRAEVEIVNGCARRLICVSAGIRDALVAQGVRGELCSVVYNAIDIHQALPEPVALPETARGAIVIGSVGSLLPRKANDQLLRAAALLLARGVNGFHLVLVGDGPQRAQLEALATQSGLTAHVTFAGFQSNALAWESALDIVVLASAGEGFPRVVLEAMLLGKPVVASDVVGSRELVEDGHSGFLYPYADIDALADRLQHLLASPELRARMGSAGRQSVREKHAIEAYVNGVEHELQRGAAR